MRVPDVLDCWFESGAMPFAQPHYPFERKTEFERDVSGGLHRRVRRADPRLVLHAACTAAALFRRHAFRNAVCHGVMLGSDGRKMSKRLRNYPDPMELV